MSARPSSEQISHGRGGEGNIGPDATEYTDGSIVREGPPAGSQAGAASTGRGGAANIANPGSLAPPSSGEDIVPESATRPSQEGNYHVGRGGEGNIHQEEKVVTHKGLADKIKHKIFKPKSST